MKHIRGDTFDYIVTFEAEVADGAFFGFVPTCQIRDMRGKLIDDVVTDWVDSVTTRSVSLHVSDTSAWKAESAVFDIQFTRPSDNYIRSTFRKQFEITEDTTRP